MTAKVVACPIATGEEARDTLLRDFTCGQRDYIIYKLYPIIKKALVHFIAEATLQNEIVERKEEPPQPQIIPINTSHTIQKKSSTNSVLAQNQSRNEKQNRLNTTGSTKGAASRLSGGPKTPVQRPLSKFFP